MAENIPEVVTDIRAVLGEGPSWDARNAVLYWVDIIGGKVHVHNPTDRSDRTIPVQKYVSAVVPRKSGGAVVTLQHGYYSLDLASGRFEPLSEQVETEIPGNRFNDGKVDPAGRFWAGTMDMAERGPKGALYVLEKNRALRKVLSGVSISNGLGWNPNNKVMYYIDTPTRKVAAFDYDLQSGAITNRRTAVDFTVQNQKGNPDGLAVDAEGMIWVAHWGGSRITRWDPARGTLLDTISFPALQVSSCCFGGKNLDELYVTTARNELDSKILEAQPLTGALFMVRPGVRGLPTYAYDG